MTAHIWLALSDTALTAFKERRATEGEYTGPVSDRAYRLLSYCADLDTREKLFSNPTLGGKVVHMFSLSFSGHLAKVKEELDWLVSEYASHAAVVGAWWHDGRQVGTNWVMENVLDDQGNPIQIGEDEDGPIYQQVQTDEVEGTPAYPIPNWAYQMMPPVNVYDGNGDLVSSTPASSNLELRDVNLIYGQTPRRFA